VSFAGRASRRLGLRQCRSARLDLPVGLPTRSLRLVQCSLGTPGEIPVATAASPQDLSHRRFLALRSAMQAGPIWGQELTKGHLPSSCGRFHERSLVRKREDMSFPSSGATDYPIGMIQKRAEALHNDFRALIPPLVGTGKSTLAISSSHYLFVH
jgi:hypothetical protein